MAVERQLMTAEELLALPDDHLLHELIAGELTTMAPMGSEHGWATINVSTPLDQYVRKMRLGRVFAADSGFVLARDPDTVRAPDVAFVRRERVEEVGRVRGYWPGAPALAVDVISPNDLYTEVEKKVATWLAHGTRMVLVVNPRRRAIAVHLPGQPMRRLTEADAPADGSRYA